MKYTPDAITKLIASWEEYMASSWDRGTNNLKSLYACSSENNTPQYKSTMTDSLSLNFKHKIIRTAQAQSRNISLALKVSALDKKTSVQEDLKAFQEIMEQIILTVENKDSFAQALDKVYDYGQAALHVKPMLVDSRTLNKVLTVENIRDLKSVFFDGRAERADFSDGQFCGRRYNINGAFLKKSYPRKLKGLNNGSEYEVIDFWYRSLQPFEFIKLENGSYKRSDLITSSDEVIMNDTVKSTLPCVYYQRVIKGFTQVLESNTYNNNLFHFPIVFNSGGTFWMDDQYESFPLGYQLEDTQKFLNYTASAILHISKQMEADKYFFTAEQVKNKGKNTMKELHQRGGAFLLDGSLKDGALNFRREQSQQLPPAFLELFQGLQTVIQSLAGSYFDNNSSEIKAYSGVALDKLFNRVDLLQNIAIYKHLLALNQVGMVIKELLPTYYFQEREVGDYTINQKTTNPQNITTVSNNIMDFTRHFDYKVDVGVSDAMRDQNMQTQLNELYQIFPQAIPQTIDLYINSLDIKDKEVLKRRLAVNIPPPLIRYGDGDSTLQEYQQEMQQLQAPAQQQQMAQAQQMQAEQQVQQEYLQAKTQAEQLKAQIAQFEAETERMKVQSENLNKHIDSVAKAAQVSVNHQNNVAKNTTAIVSHLTPRSGS